MCTRFVYHGDDMITGFNFDIDLDVWDHKIIKEKNCFFIGILRPDGIRHSYHGVNRNGNVGTLLYVHGNPEGAYQDGKGCTTIAELTELRRKSLLTLHCKCCRTERSFTLQMPPCKPCCLTSRGEH